MNSTLPALILLSFLVQLICPTSYGQSEANLKQIPMQMKDNAREIPNFLDLGLFQTYRFTEAEIKMISAERLHQLIEIYIRRYYDLYLYFSRDIIAKQCADGYPADLIDPVVQQTLSLGDDQLRMMLIDFYHHDNGVTKENTRLYSQIKPILENWEMKKFGKINSKKLPAAHSPNAIFLAYIKKMGIRPLDYYPPFYPQSKLDQVIKEENPKFQFIEYLIFFSIGCLFGILIDRKLIQANRTR